MSNLKLLNFALDARKNSYSPYSKFSVGAAILLSDNTIITGQNIENASYGACNCAERTAIFNAVSQRKNLISSTQNLLVKKKQQKQQYFLKIAILGANHDDSNGDVICAPCGICRQVLREFVDPNEFQIVLAPVNNLKKMTIYTLNELLPISFGPDNLKPNILSTPENKSKII
jgi:cytidine deaminase